MRKKALILLSVLILMLTACGKRVYHGSRGIGRLMGLGEWKLVAVDGKRVNWRDQRMHLALVAGIGAAGGPAGLAIMLGSLYGTASILPGSANIDLSARFLGAPELFTDLIYCGDPPRVRPKLAGLSCVDSVSMIDGTSVSDWFDTTEFDNQTCFIVHVWGYRKSRPGNIHVGGDPAKRPITEKDLAMYYLELRRQAWLGAMAAEHRQIIRKCGSAFDGIRNWRMCKKWHEDFDRRYSRGYDRWSGLIKDLMWRMGAYYRWERGSYLFCGKEKPYWVGKEDPVTIAMVAARLAGKPPEEYEPSESHWKAYRERITAIQQALRAQFGGPIPHPHP